MSSELPILIQRIEKEHLQKYLISIQRQDQVHLLRNDIITGLIDYFQRVGISKVDYRELAIYNVFKNVQELIVRPSNCVLVYRFKIASYRFYRVSFEDMSFAEISIEAYLNLRDFIIGNTQLPEHPIKIDFLPFYDYAPSIKAPHDIRNGIQFLNKYLSSNLIQYPEKWNTLLFHFIQIHQMQGKQLLIDGSSINSLDRLFQRIEFVIDNIEAGKYKEKNINNELKELGFLPGWGRTPQRIRETMVMLLELFNAPGPQRLENFISRIPMISKIAIISPHGWFGQKNVLGRPDTGGQVVYILDQIKYLEENLKQSLHESGLSISPKLLIVTRLIPENEGTTSHREREKVENTENCWIIRVPFHHQNGSIHQKWISRFHIYPYLEKYASEVKEVLIQEYMGRPDLVIGNYTDGNLVATFLAKDLNITQCNVAHALEKSKYLFSDLYWEKLEKEYNFSLQFTADLISMNMASFIITSTFQEIAGTSESIGQYESYLHYSLPKLYHVRNGINLFHPKFNVVPPGVADTIYFPYYEKEKRDESRSRELRHLLFDDQSNKTWGNFEDKEKTPIFVMSRLDKIKNVTGFVECYARNTKLHDMANVIVVAGKLNPDDAVDEEEKTEIIRFYEILDKYELHSLLRWIPVTFKRNDVGEVYRILADIGGIFVQPALFEAFGLTVLEAMASGLPTFATKFGGPSEIIQHGINGFLINPTIHKEMSQKIIDFLQQCSENTHYWEAISKQAIERVSSAFNWNLYSKRLLNLSKLYGFWKYTVSTKSKQKMSLYCDLIYDDFIRKRLS